MFSRSNAFLGVMALALLQGCTGVTSVEVAAGGDTNLGPTYFVPTTLIPITISVAEGAGSITLAATEPVYVPDMDAGEYRLNSIYSPVHAEKFNITTTPNGLLTNIDYVSDARLDEALVNLAKSAGAVLRPENQTTPKVVFSTSIDLAALVGDGTSLASNAALADLNARIQGALVNAVKGKNTGFLGRAASTARPIMTLSVQSPAASASAVAADERDKCRVGFCYRRPIPYSVRATFFDGSEQEKTVEVPNGAPIRAAALNRGLFTKWTNAATLTNGMLTNYTYETDASEAERLALLPFELVGGAIDGLTKQGELWDAASARLTSQQSYEEKVLELRKQPESSTRLSLFRMTAGEPSTNLNQASNPNPQANPQTEGAGVKTPGGPKSSGSSGTGR